MYSYQPPNFLSRNNLYPQNVGGRPKQSVKPVVLQAPDTPAGFEFANGGDPAVVAQAKELYLKEGKNSGMPDGLSSYRGRTPQVIENRRRNAISKGWNSPRGYS